MGFFPLLLEGYQIEGGRNARGRGKEVDRKEQLNSTTRNRNTPCTKRKRQIQSSSPSVSTPAASTCLPLRLSSRMLTHGNPTGIVNDQTTWNQGGVQAVSLSESNRSSSSAKDQSGKTRYHKDTRSITYTQGHGEGGKGRKKCRLCHVTVLCTGYLLEYERCCGTSVQVQL